MSLISDLQGILSADQVLVGDDLLDRYNHIWEMDTPLKAVAALLPRTTEDVSAVLKICTSHKQKVAVHGGLTNLVGGTETLGDELVISLEKMNRVLEVDPDSRTITVESGVILQHIHDAVEKVDMFFPLNFGAKGTAQVGGIISSNAGGLRVLKYGMTRQLVLGLEAVTADGTIVSSLKKIIKDNSGYDLKQLFIGSEGTLGIVTKAVLKLYENPTSRQSAMVGINDYSQVVAFLKHMDGGLAGQLSGYELMWENFYSRVTTPIAEVKPPLPHSYKYYVLVESLGTTHTSDQQRMSDLVEEALEKGIILDGVLAHNQSDLEWFWKIREDVKVAVSQMEEDQHFDISLPIPLIGPTIEKIHTALYSTDGVEFLVTFGHVADGNIHLIIGKNSPDPELTATINDIIYEPLQDIGGSVSAEHGIGLHKKAYLHLCRKPEEVATMKLLKRAMDPDNILNSRHLF